MRGYERLNALTMTDDLTTNPIDVVAGLTRRANGLAEDIQAQIRRLPGDASTDDLAVLSAALVRLAGRLNARAEALAEEGGSAPHVETPGLDEAQDPDEDPIQRRSGLAIIAVNLALEGNSREEIQRYLLHRFGIESTAELIDEALREG